MENHRHICERSIDTLGDIKGKKILMRVDLNITLDGSGCVPKNDIRVHRALDSIQKLSDKGARLVLITHMGDATKSVRPLYEYMKEFVTLGFIPRYDSELIQHSLEHIQEGGVLLLENLRTQEGEFSNDSSFLDVVVRYCDIYVNDAFSVSHRRHASVSDITKKLPSYFGSQFCTEVSILSKTRVTSETRGCVLVLGGAKFGTKLDLLRKFLPHIDYALVGGALANVFLRERGFAIGASFADSVDIRDMVDNPKIVLPIDAIDQEGDMMRIDEVRDHDMILDIGPATEKLFEKIIDNAETVLWNGPMGKYEEGYNAGSLALAESIAHAEAFSVTGGGDTAAVIIDAGMQDAFDFISTGGGAMLDFLVQGTLPAIDDLLLSEEEKTL